MKTSLEFLLRKSIAEVHARKALAEPRFRLRRYRVRLALRELTALEGQRG
jgi:hypothetical protein